MSMGNIVFSDSMTFDPKTKRAISVRDGVLEYLGAEIGEEPADKTFTVYRSPATIAQAAAALPGIFLVDGHISLDGELKDGLGSIKSARVVDMFDEATDTRLAVENSIKFSDGYEMTSRELSLGYRANLVEHDKYDFEQRDIEPHHLAVVEAGRCGSACSFLDKKGGNMKNRFIDEEGNPDLEEIMKIATELPEALKNVPVEQLSEILPKLKEIVAMGGEEVEDEEMEEVVDEEKDEEKEDMKDEEEEEKKDITDSSEFKDALKSAVSRHTEVIEKARQFVDEAYSFIGKGTDKIMRDALSTEHGKTKFSDEELSVAFKLLKKTDSSLRNFGDAMADGFDKLKDKEI